MRLISALFVISIIFISCGSNTRQSQLSSETRMEGYWSSWLMGNPNGITRSAVYIRDAKITQIVGKEQGGYGLVNLAILGKDEINSQRPDWSTANFNGREVSGSLRNGEVAIGLAVKEQAGHGIIDARLLSTESDSEWITHNPNATTEPMQLECDMGHQLAGLQVKEQAGFGIIDARFYCKKI